MAGDGKGRYVYVALLPRCDFDERCDYGENGLARFDFRSKRGPWGYGCIVHFVALCATPILGTGNGQLLLLPGEDFDTISSSLQAFGLRLS